MKEPKTIEITLPSDPEIMSIVRNLVSTALEKVCPDETLSNRIVLAVDEACSNIIRHCYDGDTTKHIRISLTVAPDSLVVSIRDFGKKCNPESFPCRNPEEIKPGGLGLHFIRSIMDEVEFVTSHESGNELKMVKKIDFSKKHEEDETPKPAGEKNGNQA